MIRRAVLAGILLLASAVAIPEIEEIAQPCETGFCLAWWPKLEPAKGWHHERGPSFANGVNVQVPDGFTFSNAETVIYAKALYKPRIPKTTSLAVLIKDDEDDFLEHEPDIKITKVQSLKTGDGKALESYTFFPKDKGNWEQVSYGEEAEFYLVFTISSRSRAGYLASLQIYKQYIAQYKE